MFYVSNISLELTFSIVTLTLNKVFDLRQSIYNSVCACRDIHINSFASTPLNATQIAVMKGINWRKRMVWPEICIFDL